MIQVREPQTPEEFKAYYALRWKLLRKPWSQPKGSEKDDKEKEAYHLMAIKEEESLSPLGIGRLHLNNKKEAQIRYMGVKEDYQGEGIGSSLLKKLESKAQEWKVEKITLNARENAIGFYKNFGYKIVKKAHTLFGEIPHYKMEKLISK